MVGAEHGNYGTQSTDHTDCPGRFLQPDGWLDYPFFIVMSTDVGTGDSTEFESSIALKSNQFFR
jgi:hypothetical protein